MADSTAPLTLAIDIGGSGLKADVIDADGTPVAPRQRIDTPHPAPPQVVLDAVALMAQRLPAFDRVSAGFPGVVRRGTIYTAPHLGTQDWAGFDFAAALQQRLGKPARVLNDAEVQGFGLISGQGLELVLTLGTGAGTALFRDGAVAPHLELSQHPVHKGMTYDDYVGNAALEAKGTARWNRRVERVIGLLFTLTHFDRLHLGGGNAEKVRHLPDNVIRGQNEAGLTGGIRLWGPGWQES